MRGKKLDPCFFHIFIRFFPHCLPYSLRLKYIRVRDSRPREENQFIERNWVRNASNYIIYKYIYICTYKTAYTPAHFSQSKANEHDRRKAQECSAKQSALNAPNIFVWLSVNWKFSKEMPVAFGRIISVQMWMGLKELAEFIVMGIRQTNQTSKI